MAMPSVPESPMVSDPGSSCVNSDYTEIIVVRHGETAWNADGRIQGGGESRDQLHQRCTSSLQRIGDKHKGERVVVVTHWWVIRTVHNKACPNGTSAGKTANASVNIFQLSDEDKWTIKSWGDVSHLNQTDYLESSSGGDRKSG